MPNKGRYGTWPASLTWLKTILSVVESGLNSAAFAVKSLKLAYGGVIIMTIYTYILRVLVIIIRRS